MSGTAPDLYLSPSQQGLLLAALNSNRPKEENSKMMSGATSDAARRSSTRRTSDRRDSVDQIDDGPSYMDSSGNQDESYNFDDSDLFGDGHDESPDAEEDVYAHLHDKRKSSGGQDEDDDEDGGGGKRQEGEDKTAKKPGRKPLTSEPTTKRKAQNRAAQRAFRDRKEKHLKDLETKVVDLEKASEADKNEKGELRAQVERLQVELKEYRKRLSWVSSQNPTRAQSMSTSSRNNPLNTGTSDFQFQFPQFGDTPLTGLFGQPTVRNPSQSGRNPQPPRTGSLQASPSPVSNSNQRNSFSNAGVNSTSMGSYTANRSPINNLSTSPQPLTRPDLTAPHLQQNSIDSLSGLFSPSILAATANDNNYFGYGSSMTDTLVRSNTSRGSVDASHSTVPGLYSGSSASNTESPESLSDSQNHGLSIGTSPDTAFTSPATNLQDFGLSTINEGTSFMPTNTVWNVETDFTSGLTNNGVNWLAQHQGDGFDPVLFGDYREAQDNVLNQDFGSFFNEAYPLPDLGSPTHNYGSVPPQGLDAGKKSNLMQSVEAAKNAEPPKLAEVPRLMTCNKIWDRLQSMEKFRNGEIDIDNLCSELRAKAKCSDGGAAVDEKHVNRILGI